MRLNACNVKAKPPARNQSGRTPQLPWLLPQLLVQPQALRPGLGQVCRSASSWHNFSEHPAFLSLSIIGDTIVKDVRLLSAQHAFKPSPEWHAKTQVTSI
jgi:hypothetical protein